MPLPSLSALVDTLRRFVSSTVGPLVTAAQTLLRLMSEHPVISMAVAASVIAIAVGGSYYFVNMNANSGTVDGVVVGDILEFDQFMRATYEAKKRQYECPISLEIMRDPVDTLCCQSTYDRASVAPYFNRWEFEIFSLSFLYFHIFWRIFRI